MSSIEERVFELAEQHTVADLDKLIRLLGLLLNGKRHLDTPLLDKPFVPTPAPKATKASAKPVSTPDPSEDDGF